VSIRVSVDRGGVGIDRSAVTRLVVTVLYLLGHYRASIPQKLH
jgi:hypothetical protein